MGSFIKQLENMNCDVYGSCAPQRHNKLKYFCHYNIHKKREYFHNDRICTYFGINKTIIGINNKQKKIMNAYYSDIWKEET
jgi:hypothetical protein